MIDSELYRSIPIIMSMDGIRTIPPEYHSQLKQLKQMKIKRIDLCVQVGIVKLTRSEDGKCKCPCHKEELS